MSGDKPVTPVVVLPPALERLVGVLHVLTAPDLPAVALIGGMAVNIRLSTAAGAHRATRDLDLVANEATPTAVEVLSRGGGKARDQTVVVDGIEVDIIETHPVSDRDLEGLEDGQRLFVAGHRWALETASVVRVAPAGDASGVAVPVAGAAGLVTSKSHAAGHPRAARRETKHGGDLYDIFRLVEVFDAQGVLRSELAAAPGG
ncbi:MAG: hypothetical protein ACRDY6_16075, partial [Acidimicrobiia bacterium]